jgi:hypothetical protein
MLLGPVSGATPGAGNPIFDFIVGGIAITAVWVNYFRSEEAKRPSIRNPLFISIVGAVFIGLGVWALISQQ